MIVMCAGKHVRVALALLMLTVSAGCSDVLGFGLADAEVLVSGDNPATATGHPVEGTVTLEVRVLLLTAEAFPFPVQISGGARQIEVDVGGEVPVSLGKFAVNTSVYGGVRVVFSSVRAELTSGLGAPPFTGGGEVQVDFGSSGTGSRDRSFSIGLRDGDELEVALDLGASSWIEPVASAPAPRTVSADDFLEHVRIETRIR
jgi:hypothetical protein